VSLDADIRVTQGRLELDVELHLDDGEMVALLGPNGAGKTTLLRTLAGLLPMAAGSVRIDGADVTTLPPEQRPVGMVFQDHLLFPHLTALDNVAFGVRARGARRTEARRTAVGWLADVGLADRAAARPRQLSGGEAQRVALARALAVSPRLLLLDEPLAALDATTRVQVRAVLRRHLAGFDGARLLVTHDPLEAFAMADRLIVIEDGHIVQSGSVAEVSARPRSRYVADLVGVNLFRGRGQGDHIDLGGGRRLAVAAAGSGDVFAVVHPRAVSLFRQPFDGTPRNSWPGPVEALDHEGDRVRVRVGGLVPLVAEVTPAAVADQRLVEGATVWVAVKATDITVFPA